MKNTKNTLLILLLAAFFASLSVNMAWAAYPDRPITFIVTMGAGGSTDLVARALAKTLEKKLGQPLIVENRAGGGTTLGEGAIAAAKPDGYTIGTTLWTGPALTPHEINVPFNIDSFEYIMICGSYMYGIAVKSDSPFKTLKDLVDFAKQNPGKLKYSTSGATTPKNFGMVRLGKATGVKWDNVSFKSGPEASTACLGGHVGATAVNPMDVMSFIEAGRMRLLASMSDTRWKWVPDAPTLRELGYDIYETAYFGIGTPKGVPKPIMDKLREVSKEVMKDPEYLASLEKFYLIADYKTGDEYRKLLEQASKQYERLLMEMGLHKSQKK
jgi:tripartite-type tricarboxylate transporter receptor subunit TctC